jgi:hypothetical protein
MDVPEGGRGDQSGVRRRLPPGTREPFAQSFGIESAKEPERRANQRDEEAIKRWKEERWPEPKKGR